MRVVTRAPVSAVTLAVEVTRVPAATLVLEAMPVLVATPELVAMPVLEAMRAPQDRLVVPRP